MSDRKIDGMEWLRTMYDVEGFNEYIYQLTFLVATSDEFNESDTESLLIFLRDLKKLNLMHGCEIIEDNCHAPF